MCDSPWYLYQIGQFRMFTRSELSFEEFYARCEKRLSQQGPLIGRECAEVLQYLNNFEPSEWVAIGPYDYCRSGLIELIKVKEDR